ncbi:UDP-N-acetylmuramate--L-alanine ligase [Iodidimonas sp. SYSU 1G8]
MMKTLPFDIGTIHFVGIGGIGMSGIAEVMRNLGHTVRGSDLSESANVKRLRGLGIDVVIGHAPENIADAKVIVISSAVKADNPEVKAARARLIPVVKRAEMLAELMRLKWCISIAGTHGKTTTTSMIAAVLDSAGFDPTVINGGIINAYGTNARLGEGEWMVVEADESDGTFVKLPAMLAVVTNIDPEHMEHYGTFDALRDAFKQFVERTPFYGSAILCIDHPEVQTLVGRISDRRIVTYGMSAQADVRARNVSYAEGVAHFDVEIADRATGSIRRIDGLSLPMPGRHNVVNALAAVSAATVLGLPDDAVRNAFQGFSGVGRRFTKVGEVGGRTIIDDYAHHPVEIAAVLSAAREAYRGRVIAVVQPHRYTRLQNLFEGFSTCFNDADTVVVTDVYPAGEAPIEGIGGIELAQGIRSRGHRHVLHIPGEAELAATVASISEPGDVIVCMGAGSISAWANGLPKRLTTLGGGA